MSEEIIIALVTGAMISLIVIIIIIIVKHHKKHMRKILETASPIWVEFIDLLALKIPSGEGTIMVYYPVFKSKKDDKTASTPLVTISDLQKMKQFEVIIMRLRLNPFKTKFIPYFKWEIKKYLKTNEIGNTKYQNLQDAVCIIILAGKFTRINRK